MVSRIVWLGVKDVFTQIAKDVVGQGLDHGTLTFKVMLVGEFWFGPLLEGCGISCRTIACSDATEGNEMQKPVKVAWSYSWSVTEVDLANDREERVSCNVLDATFILKFSSSQMFSLRFRDSLASTETERNALMFEDFS
uniref:Uncharacterized protein n=1 Tax=Brassica oleracea var. oleracea TaxID=109376 RepID=A0A0D3BQP8_BRAOL